MKVAIASAKGSPGVTTLIQALASVWRGNSPLVVELDPAGGDLATRLGLRTEPGIVSLASAGRRGITAQLVAKHSQRWGGVELLLGPPSAATAGAAVAVIAEALGYLDLDIVADCGRLTPISPSLAWCKRADATVLVLRPTAQEVAHAGGCVETLRSVGVIPRLVVVGGPGPGRRSFYPAAEVAAALDCPLLAITPIDNRTADYFASRRRTSPRVVEHSPLLRSAREVRKGLTAAGPPRANPVVGGADSDHDLVESK